MGKHVAAPVCDHEQPSVSLTGLSPPRTPTAVLPGHDLSLLRLGPTQRGTGGLCGQLPVDVRVVATGRPDSQAQKAGLWSVSPRGQPGCGVSGPVFAGGLNVTPGPVCGPALPSECRLGAAVHFFLFSLAAPLQALGWFSSFRLDLQDNPY